jgi:hypothetical protein
MLRGPANATNSTAAGSGLCAQLARNSSGMFCYVPDIARRSCTRSNGTSAASLCSAAGPELAFSEPTPCCNKLAQLGVSKQDMQGACAPLAAEAVPMCYSPNLAAGSCNAVADAALCNKLWATQGQIRAQAKAQVFDTQLACCNSVAAAVGFAKTAGSCNAAMVRTACKGLFRIAR